MAGMMNFTCGDFRHGTVTGTLRWVRSRAKSQDKAGI